MLGHWVRSPWAVNNCEGSEISTHLQVNRSAPWDTQIQTKPETSGTETKDFSMNIAAGSQSFGFHWFLLPPKSPRHMLFWKEFAAEELGA